MTDQVQASPGLALLDPVEVSHPQAASKALLKAQPLPTPAQGRPAILLENHRAPPSHHRALAASRPPRDLEAFLPDRRVGILVPKPQEADTPAARDKPVASQVARHLLVDIQAPRLHLVGTQVAQHLPVGFQVDKHLLGVIQAHKDLPEVFQVGKLLLEDIQVDKLLLEDTQGDNHLPVDTQVDQRLREVSKDLVEASAVKVVGQEVSVETVVAKEVLEVKLLEDLVVNKTTDSTKMEITQLFLENLELTTLSLLKYPRLHSVVKISSTLVTMRT